MKHVLLSLALIGLGGTSAFAKPKVAILGLEVTGDIDQVATTVARDLTEGMRSRAKAANGPYLLAPNSDRELIDEKVINECGSEAPACMSAIGKGVGADLLVYGKLEKDGAGYQATIVLLDVKTRASVKTTFVAVPPSSGKEDLKGIARKTYLELAPTESATTPAKLVVTANVPSGQVLVDDEQRATLSGGRATLTLPEGRYRIAIEAAGYGRQESTVKLADDETRTESFELSAAARGGDRGTNVWKPIFAVTAVIAVGLGGYSTYELVKMRDEAAAFRGVRRNGATGNVNEADCADPSNVIEEGMADHLGKACSHYTRHKRTAYAASVVGAAAAVTGVVAFFVVDKQHPSARVALTPSISPTGSPTGASASLRVDW